MKKIYLILFIIYFSFQYALAQWKQVFPLGLTANDVFFTSEQLGYIIGSASGTGKGLILKTINSGVSWEKVYETTYGLTLRSVWFTNATTGYVLTDNTVLKTSDGGNSWNQIAASIGNNFQKIRFTSPQVGYINEQKGSVLKTTDGGQTWTNTQVPASSSSVYNSDMSFVNDTVGYVLTEFEVFKTTNGGISWKKLPVNNYRYKSVFFVSEKTGYLISDYSGTYKTIDGGDSWQFISGGWSAKFSYFVDEQTGLFFSDYSQISKTTDGGTSSQGVYDSNYTFSWTAVHFPTKDFGCAIGNGAILITQDGGQSWQMHNRPTDNAGRFHDIHFFPNGNGMAVGEFYGIVRTPDTGKSWHIDESSFSRSDKYGIYFADADTGFVVVTNNGRYQTYDGGKTFFVEETQRAPFIGHLSSSDYLLLGSKVIYSTGGSVGRGGRIAKSVDGGKSWTIDENPPFENYLSSIVFPSRDTGYACGIAGKVVKTVDGGTTWQEQDPKINNDLMKIYFLNPTYGFAIGSYGALIRTTDGGIHWNSVSSGIGFPLVSIHFFTDSLGYVGSSGGHIAKTTNGGQTWKVITDTKEQLQDIEKYYFKDTSTVIAMGAYALFQRDLTDRNTPSLPPVTGITEELTSLDQSFRLYPNPAQNSLTLSYPLHLLPKEIILYNNQGKMMYHDTTLKVADQLIIPISIYPPGLYLLKIVSGENGVITRKVYKY